MSIIAVEDQAVLPRSPFIGPGRHLTLSFWRKEALSVTWNHLRLSAFELKQNSVTLHVPTGVVVS